MADLKNYKIYKNTNFQVLTHEGFKDFEGIMCGENKDKVKLTFSDNEFLICTPKHKIVLKDNSIIYAKDLKINDVVFDGSHIKDISFFENDEKVYELLHVHDTHKYLINNKLSKNCIVIDEMSFIPNNFMDDFWKSTIPVVSSSKKSKIFAISTANGTSNLFYTKYSEAERGESKDGWVAERIDWWEVPGRDEKWKIQTIAALGSVDYFDQEFGNNFLQVGESVLNAEVLKRYRNEVTNPTLTLQDNCYKIWEQPQKKRIYVMGADIGEGIGSTASTIQVLDLTDLTKIKQVACYRNQNLNPYNFAKVLYEIAGQWGSPYIFMERNNVGSGVIDSLFHTFKYEKIATHVPNNSEIQYERMGIYSHTNVKLDSVTNMRYWVNDMQSVEIKDIATIQEFETFVRYPNGTWKKKLGEAIYDDMVTALMWGLYALKNEVTEKYFDILQYDDRGRPLKIGKTSYDDEQFFGSQALSKNFNDGDPMPSIISAPSELNDDLDNLKSDGWQLHDFNSNPRY